MLSVTLLNPFTGARAPRVELPLAGEHVAAASSSEHVSRVRGRWVLHPTNGYEDADAAGRAIKLEGMRDVFFREIVLSTPSTVSAWPWSCLGAPRRSRSAGLESTAHGRYSTPNWSSPWGPSSTAKTSSWRSTALKKSSSAAATPPALLQPRRCCHRCRHLRGSATTATWNQTVSCTLWVPW